MVVLWLLLSCSEQTIRGGAYGEIAEPPGDDVDDLGGPPDWSDCSRGYQADYFNLTASHPDFDPPKDARDPDTFDGLDWWDDVHGAFTRFEPSLDQGSNWWPVDEGYADDPAYFSVYLTAWIRVWQDGSAQFVAGAADDMWVTINNQTVISLPGIKDFKSEVYTVDLASGQYPLEVRFAHRRGDTAISFRPVDSDLITICYPDFSTDTGR